MILFVSHVAATSIYVVISKDHKAGIMAKLVLISTQSRFSP